MDELDEQAVQSREKLDGFQLLMTITEFAGISLIILVIIWTTYFRGGFAWTSDPGHQFNWHPLLMTIGFVFLYANGILIYRCQRKMRKRRLKLIHGGIMMLTLIFTVIGLISVFDFHNLSIPPIPNMYTLHSWVGMTSVVLFCCQWVCGCVSFLSSKIDPPLRSAYLPIHVYFGIAGFIGGIASCLMGLDEKAIFTIKEKYTELIAEGVLINTIGMFLIIFCGLTVYIVSREGYKREARDEDNLLLDGRRDYH